MKTPPPRLRLGPKLHDSFFRALFGGHPLAAAGALRSLLPPPLAAAIDFDRLERAEDDFVTARLSRRRADLVFRAPLRDQQTWLVWLFEQQHAAHRLMAWRVFDYTCAAWRDIAERHRADHGRDLDALPAIIPLVLYTGRRPWREPRTLTTLVDLPPPLLTHARPYLPEFTLHVDALHATDDATLRARGAGPIATLGWLLFKHAPRARDIAERMAGWIDELRAVADAPGGGDALATMVEYTLRVSETRAATLGEVLGEALGDDGEEVVMTTGKMLELQGWKKGREEGVSQGMTRILLAQLEQRFGALPRGLVERVQGETDHDVLARWASRVLTAASPDEVIEG
ncbi:MAG: Rpn family recombination-promoting nuclease/putative transposase [Myxococcales bacterium]|nr:Rpn family recombination-promoting nuclease/putative transposase [Myxococcales bacterium]